MKYYLPAVVQIRKAGKLYGTWDLNPELDLKFGNDQTETQYESAEGTTTSIKVTEYRSEADLEIAFNSPDNGSLARQAILKQISEMAYVIYEQVFFNDSKLKLDIAYGAGKAADYTETVTAAENAVTALEGKQYEALTNPIAIWENWLAKHDATNKKAAVNNKVAKGLHENLAIAYAFQGNYPKATEHITQALELANTGNKNLNEINRLTKFQQFIAEKEQAELNNANVDVSALKTAPNIKKLLGKRKLNAEIDFLFAEDKYQEMKDNQ
ncbi:MAG: hypothetical protein P8O05_13115 [Flavobacteriales bacterium]|nr:hypothetical protein [Flavobacteriales bacterium]